MSALAWRFVTAGVLFALACDEGPGTSAASQVMLHALAYMECDECTAAELQAVRADRDSATPILASFLTSGPPADRLAQKEQLLLAWQARVLHDSAAVLRPGTKRMFDNYTVRYKSRAAYALRKIDTPAAHAALCAAGLSSPAC